MSARVLLLSAASLLALTAAQAQDAASPASAQIVTLKEIFISADPLLRAETDVISNVGVLSGADLERVRRATLGDSLTTLPGVGSDSFGGGASRPVIRGQTAPRVKILSDGAGIFDASDISPDHAIPVEPALLEGVEILRGPSALLYGGGAIGGAVNLIDGKIPTALPARGFEGAAEIGYGTGDESLNGALGLTAGVGPFALRLEISGRDAENYRVPLYAPPGAEEHDHGHNHDHDHDHAAEEEEEGFDRVPDSFRKSETVSLGGSWIGSRGHLGAAYTEHRSRYGLPGHSHDYEACHPHGSSLHCGSHSHGGDDHDHDHEAEGHEGASVDLVSRRVDLRGELTDPFTGFERLRLRGGFTDYEHEELDHGEVATSFSNRGYDLRLEAQHAPIGGLHGVIGAQFAANDFAAEGRESFIPESDTRNGAIFLLEEYKLGDWRFEGALRQEWQETSVLGRPDAKHSPLSVSLGANWAFAPGYSASLSFGRSQRAPHVQELYARGVHFATNTYEVGTPTLGEETALSFELGLRKTSGPTTFAISGYRYDYDDYIYAQTLDQHEAFRLVRYTARDAEFTGIEAEITQELNHNLSATLFGDYVRAEFAEGGELPRIPAARLGLRLDGHYGPWSGDVEYVRVFDQNRVADFEEKTSGHNLLSAGIAYDFGVGPAGAQVFLRGTNLLDETALNHASFISRQAPLHGRSVEIGLRARF